MAIAQLESPVFRSIKKSDGSPNDSGFLYVYTVGGTYSSSADQVTVWQDKAKTAEWSQPIQLDTAGEAEIWFDGAVELRIEDNSTALIDVIIGVESSPTAVVTGEYNLVQNGSFETNSGNTTVPASWVLAPYTSGVIAVDTADQVHGGYSLKFNGGGSGGGTATSAIFDVLENAGIFIDFSYRSSTTGTTNTVGIQFYTATEAVVGSVVSVYTDGGTSPTAWTPVTKFVTAPSTATKAKLILTGVLNSGGALGEDTWFDNIIVSSNINPQEMFDTPTSIVFGSAATVWTTETVSSVPDGTKTIVLQVTSTFQTLSGTYLQAYFYARPKGGTVGGAKGYSRQDAVSATGLAIGITVEFHVNINAAKQFEWDATPTSDGTIITSGTSIELVGYLK